MRFVPNVIAGEELRDAAQSRAALGQRPQRPVALRLLGCADRRVHVFLARARDRATEEIASPVAGASFANVSLLAAARSSPAMTLGTCLMR